MSRQDQDPENQLQQLREFAKASQWRIVEEFVDKRSGAGIRPQLAEMLVKADRRRFDVLLFWSLSRLTRSGILDTLNILKQLTDAGVEYHSLTEPHFRSQGPLRELIVSIFASFAQVEREALIERTKAGLQKARNQGKTLGRPRALTDAERIRMMVSEGKSLAEIARELGVSKATAGRRVKQIEAEETAPAPKESKSQRRSRKK